MVHYAVETSHVMYSSEKVLYILAAPSAKLAKEMVEILLKKETGRYVSNVDTLTNAAGIECVYVDIEYEDDNYEKRTRKTRRLRSGSKRVKRTKRI